MKRPLILVAAARLTSSTLALRPGLLLELNRVAADKVGVNQIGFFVVDAQGRRLPGAALRPRPALQDCFGILGIGDDHAPGVDDPRDAKQAAFEGRRQAILRRTDNNTPARLRVGAHGPASAELPL